MTGERHVAVIGAGITGLAAAYELEQSVTPVRISLLEASSRLGGKIRTERLAGRPLDVGAEGLLARVPQAVDLCHELGIGDALEPPREDRTYIWSGGKLRPLPPGLLGGLPGSTGALLRARILSPAGTARAALDLVLPKHAVNGDETVGSLVTRRFGRQALERLVDPLLGGIYSGDCDGLSVRATAPTLAQAASGRHRSLLRGLRAAPRSSATGPTFVALAGGLEQLVERLAAALEDAEIHHEARVLDINPATGGRYRLDFAHGKVLKVDAAVIAAPAFEAAEMLRHLRPGAARSLRAIEYASTATVSLAYPAAAAERLPRGSGFLVPRAEGRLLSACTFSSLKWPHLATDDALLLRCAVGRAGNDRALALDDAALTTLVAEELQAALGLRHAPTETLVTRWERALPQYAPGHLDRVSGIEEALASLPGLELAGAAYRGMGVPACIAQGRAAAQRVLAELDAGVPVGYRVRTGAALAGS